MLSSRSWFGLFPGGIVIEGENLLDAFGPAAAEIEENFQRSADSLQARIGAHDSSVPTATNAVENGGQIENLATRLQEIGVQGLLSPYRRHGPAPFSEF